MLKDLQDRLRKVSGLCDKVAASAEQGADGGVLVSKENHEKLLDEQAYLQAEIDEHLNSGGGGVGRKTEPDNPAERLREGTNPGGPNFNRRFNRRDDDAAQLAARGWVESKEVAPCDRDNLDDGKFSSMPDFLGAIRNSSTGKYDERLERYDTRNLTQQSAVGTDGGFLLPSLFVNDLQSSAHSAEKWLSKRRMFVAAPGTGSIVIPTLDDDNRSGKDIAGVSLSRTSESATLVTSTIKFGQQTMPLFKAGTRIIVPNELLHDSAVGFDSMVTEIFGKVLAQNQAESFMRGSGAGEPLGILGGLDQVVTTSASAAGVITLVEFADILQSLDEAGENESATWLITPAMFKIMTIMLSGAASAVESTNWFGEPAKSAPRTLFGIPMHLTSAAGVIDLAQDINLCNMSQYGYYSTPPSIAFSSEERFSSDEGVFRLILRDNGQPLRAAPLVHENSFTTANFVWADAR